MQGLDVTVLESLLFESGYSAFYTDNGDPRPYGVLTDFIPVTEQSTGAGVPFANFIYRGFNPAPSSYQKHATWEAAMSYVSGTHNMKGGYQAGYMSNRNTTYVGRQISYRFNNGLPNQLSQRVGTNRTSNSLLYNAVFIQDQWTRSRLTLQGALRYETASSWAPAGENGILTDNEFGGPFLLPRTEGVTGLPRHHAADGCGLRCVRQREDRAQGECRAVPSGRLDRGCIHDQQCRLDARHIDQSIVVGSQRKSCRRMRLPEPGDERRVWSMVRSNWASFNQTTTVNPGGPRGLGHA